MEKINAKSDAILRELRLPDSIHFWERRWGNSNNKLAEVFRFWRLRYFLIFTVIGVIAAYKNTLIAISWVFLCCLFDYILVRERAKRNFNLQLGKLKQILHNNFYEWDLDRQDTNHFNLGRNKILDLSPANAIKREWISIIIKKYLKKDHRGLDVGCNDGQISLPISKAGISLIGLDLNRSAVRHFIKRSRNLGVRGNILNLPFKNNKFDFVIFTDTIEHLFDPLDALKEIVRVLKPGGLVILTTDNRNHLKALEILNPFIILERLIGLIFSNVLLPRSILWEYGEDIRFYHTSFSKTELVSLVDNVKLKVISDFSYFFLPGFHELLGKIKPRMTENEYVHLFFPVEKILINIPLVKWFGDHWFMILKKSIT